MVSNLENLENIDYYTYKKKLVNITAYKQFTENNSISIY